MRTQAKFRAKSQAKKRWQAPGHYVAARISPEEYRALKLAAECLKMTYSDIFRYGVAPVINAFDVPVSQELPSQLTQIAGYPPPLPEAKKLRYDPREYMREHARQRARTKVERVLERFQAGEKMSYTQDTLRAYGLLSRKRAGFTD